MFSFVFKGSIPLSTTWNTKEENFIRILFFIFFPRFNHTLRTVRKKLFFIEIVEGLLHLLAANGNELF